MTDKASPGAHPLYLLAGMTLALLSLAACTKPTVEQSMTEGLEITVVTEGEGPAVAEGDIAVMHYTGWLYDAAAEDGRGRKFDSSRDRNATFEFPVGAGRVIRGWDVGVPGMQVGETRILRIEPDLGYGSRGAGGVIPPDATLVFEVELVAIK